MSFESEPRRPSSRNKVGPLNEKLEILEMNSYNDVSMGQNKSTDFNENKQIISNKIEPKDDEDYDDEEEDDDAEDEEINKNLLIKARKFIASILSNSITKKVLLALLAIGFIVFFSFGMKLNNPFNIPSDGVNVLQEYVFNNNKGLALFVLTMIAILFIIWDNFLSSFLSKLFDNQLKFIADFFEQKYIKKYGSWAVLGAVFIAIVVYLALTIDQAANLISLSGIIVYALICVLLSTNPAKINWHVLLSGIEIQFIFAVLLMRTEFGYQLFKYLSAQVTVFLEYTDRGSSLVFGEKYTDHRFAFQSIPVIIFFGAIVNLLYYLSIIQYIILKLSFVINFLMGTSPTESMNATANIFLGQTEAPLLIKPFLPKMTKSEIFSVMTGGFATVSGSVLAAYIGFGIPANNLIICSIMAAPGALAVSKTIFPELKKTKANWDAIRNLPKGDARNVFEAIAIGATNMVGPVGGILANLIAFVAFFAFLDAIVIWLFGIIHLENFGLTSIMQYLFWPLAYLMGVNSEDCGSVSKLIGIKIFVNEFVAFSDLGNMIKFRNDIIADGTFDLYRNGELPLPDGQSIIWDDRSIRITTYALCGFANFGSVGIVIGCLSMLAPTRSKTITKYAVRAMIAGNMTNFITACIAGLLYEPDKL